MKLMLISILAAPILFLFGACSESSSQPKIIPVDENQNNGTVEVLVGDQIEISLPGNPTTGYEWKLSAVESNILEKLGELEYKPKDIALGAGGRYTLRLNAISPGDTWVEMAYRRPFDPQDVPSLDEYRIYVKVKP